MEITKEVIDDRTVDVHFGRVSVSNVETLKDLLFEYLNKFGILFNIQKYYTDVMHTGNGLLSLRVTFTI